MAVEQSLGPLPTGAQNRLVGPVGILAIGAALVCALLVIYWDGVRYMVHRWGAPEYNHAYMIPLVAGYLLWLRSKELSQTTIQGSWIGLVALAAALLLAVLGSFSTVLTLTQYGFVLAIWSLALVLLGWRGVKILWVPLIYLLFMVPLPSTLQYNLTADMQLISSKLGVAVIRLAGLPVYLEGNVIDLGTYRLQVAEACSGMRYLFPLMSFGFLAAALFHGPVWQRATIFLSTVPMTVLMNSLRVGIIGIIVNYWGIEQAEGFIHDFEGWVVFMACVALLFLEIWIFARMQRRGFLQVFGLDIPPVDDFVGLVRAGRIQSPLVVAMLVLVVGAVATLIVGRPTIHIPERTQFADFPPQLGEWQGRDVPLDQIYIDTLKVSDYLLAQYVNPAKAVQPTDLWVAYYDSQVGGASIHSPRACLPGGGWSIESLARTDIPNVRPDGSALAVNRAVIAMGEQRQLVYYWFNQRGRNLTNEYLVKWFIFWDGMKTKRTDGSLVRVSTYVGDVTELPAAEERLSDFVRALDPRLAYYLPDANAAIRAEVSAPETLADFTDP